MATLIDGKSLAQKFHEQIKEQVLALKAEHGIEPGLAVILVGDHPASQVYVRNKIAACEKAGIKSFHHRFILHCMVWDGAGADAGVQSQPLFLVGSVMVSWHVCIGHKLED